MNHDQADELRQLARQRFGARASAGPAVPLVVVSGGKGGVGTTTVAINLAVALARLGRRAVFVDADLDHGGNSQFGPTRQHGSLLDVLSGRRTVHEVLERGPSGVQMLPGIWASGEANESTATAQERLIGELKNMSPHADIVVADAGHSRAPLARRLWQSADSVLVVTSPQPAAIMESYAAIKVLSANNASRGLHTLVNFSKAETVAQVHARIAETCRKFLGLSVAAAGEVRAYEAAAENSPALVFPADTLAACDMEAVAERLWNQLQAATSGTRQGLALSA
jgi:flagellar biosynthesis protein FlhG